MTTRRIFTGSLVALAAMAVTAMVQPAIAQTTADLASDSLLQELKKRGTIKVGFSTFVPWAMRSKTGELIGYEVDVANKLGEDSGWKTELVPMAWDGLIPSLLSGKIDVIIAGMNSTVKRALTVAFTAPYEEGGANLVANRKTAAGRSTVEDFNTSDTIFAQRRGTTPIASIGKMFPKAQIRQFDDENTVKQELLSGRAHVVWTARPQFVFWTIDNPNELYLPMPGANLQPWIANMAVKQGDPVFMEYLNNWIRQRNIDKWLPTRHEYWFGGRDWGSLVAEN
jgi:polar amino acid transport system substrate-binding protein